MQDGVGFQLEFYPLAGDSDVISSSDCEAYAFEGGGVEICINSMGNELIAGK